jgi:hypothetical protein
MVQLITSPDKFADCFNAKVPGAYRQITAHDVKDLAACGLIGRYGYYGYQDLHTIIGILKYEQLQQRRSKKPPQEALIEPPRCKGCGQPLPIEPEGKKGRPREYCSQCEPSRAKMRYRKWRRRRRRKRKARKQVPERDPATIQL